MKSVNQINSEIDQMSAKLKIKILNLVKNQNDNEKEISLIQNKLIHSEKLRNNLNLKNSECINK